MISNSVDSKERRPLLEYKNVTVMHNNHKVLDQINLSVASGQHVAILGPNGAGKSSLIKTITRELYPIVDGADSYLRILGEERWNIFELRDRLGIVGSEVIKSNFINSSCEEVILSGLFSSAGIWPCHEVTAEMRSKAEVVMLWMGIGHLAKISIDEVSTGESRLIMLSRALVNDPPTLLLDEPTSNLDPQAAYKVRQALRGIAAEGKSIIMITHNLTDIIPEMQRVVFIRGGKIIKEGDKSRIITSSALSALFGIKLKVVRREGYFHCW